MEIKCRFDGHIIFKDDSATLILTVAAAVKAKVNLRGADMRGADMRGADMQGAKIKDGVELKAKVSILQCGPVGSRQDYLIIFNTTVGLYVKAGCFLDTLDKFVSAVREKHKGTIYEKEYMNIVKMAKEHFKIHAKD